MPTPLTPHAERTLRHELRRVQGKIQLAESRHAQVATEIHHLECQERQLLLTLDEEGA